MIVPTDVRFVDEKLQQAFKELAESKGDEKQLYEWLKRAFTDIETNGFCGIQVPKKLIPKEYSARYGVKNLWKYNLPNVWRLLYSIEQQEVVVVSIILEWLDHKDYERRFNY